MKIAILLALHNHPEQANLFISQYLKNPGCHIFIHIDKKSLSIEKQLIKHDQVHVLPVSLSVSWGDYTQIEYVIRLMKFASDYDHFDYYSIHSGNDLLVRPFCELEHFLAADYKYAYLDCERLPRNCWQYGGGLGRLALYWPEWMRRRFKPRSVKRYIRSLYGHLYGWHLIRGKKLPDNIEFWGKSAWYTLRNDCVVDCLNYLETHPDFCALFKDSLCGDEIFFCTLVHLVCKDEVISNNNLRYIDMEHVNKSTPGAPMTITMADIDKVKASGAFWARKFEADIDNEVIQYYLQLTSK